MSEPTPEAIEEALDFARRFDAARHCGWNSSNHACQYGEPEYKAHTIPAFASLGANCTATLRELALLQTLRPCRDCGSTTLYAHNYAVSCCDCFGDEDDCSNVREAREAGEEDTGCHNAATNANLPDAITRWNLNYATTGPSGQCQIIL